MQLVLPWSVELALTVFDTVLCCVLFLYIYLQLWLLLHYKQKRLSHQTLCMFLCLLWVGFRTILFSFYLKNCVQANGLQPFPHWLLYCFPVCLQFFTLCLLNLYFSQVIFKARCSPELNKYKIPLRIGVLFTSITLLIVNLFCGFIAHSSAYSDQHKWIMMTRIIVNESLYVACSFTLASCSYKIFTMSSAYVYLESKGTSGCRAVVIGFAISGLCIVRTCYNLVTIFVLPENKPSPYSYGWNGESDHAALEEMNGLEYLLFGIFFFFCELLPMSMMVYFFRAKRLNQNLAAAGMVNSHSFGSRAYFFDNPRRYDSDDDLPRLAAPKGERGSLPSTPNASGWYGTICPTNSCAIPPPLLSGLPVGTPLLFTCGNMGAQLA
ncbi:integral membrane protein GPR137C [Discoglossus pictus]